MGNEQGTIEALQAWQGSKHKEWQGAIYRAVGRAQMNDILGELSTIKEAAEAAVALSEDPILTDRLATIVTEVEGWIDQLTPRAAETMVEFPQEPAVQPSAIADRQEQPLGAAPSQTEPIGTENAPAANADVGGAEDEPSPTLGTPSTEDRASGSDARPDETRTPAA